MHGYTIGSADSVGGLSRWKHQWNALADAQALPMLRYEWFAAAERHLASPGSVRILHVLDSDGNLAAALPLERTAAGHGRSCYQVLGQARLYEPTGLLCRDNAACHALVRSAAALGRPVVLSRLWPGMPPGPGRDRADAAPLTGGRLLGHAVELRRTAAPSQYLRLEDGYDAYASRLSSRHRYDIRRAYRRAAEAGGLSVEFAMPGPDRLHRMLNTAFDVEARGWKGAQGSNVKANADLQGFFYQFFDSHTAEGAVLIALLRIRGAPAAAQVCLVAHDRIWILKIGYDEAFERMSPGLILMNEVIKHAHEQGVQGIEFLGSAEPWLRAWHPLLRTYGLMALYPYTPRSLACLGHDVILSLLRRTRRVRRC